MGMTLGACLFPATRQRVLGLLFANPGRSYYHNQIQRLTHAGVGAVQRELNRLAEAGLVTVQRVGNQKHYRANPAAPIFHELRGIAVKTAGLADVLRRALAPVAGQISTAFIHGSVAAGTDTVSSDVDLFIISDALSYPDLMPLLEKAEQELGRAIQPVLYSENLLQQRLEAANAFTRRALGGPRIMLLGAEPDVAGA